MAVSDEPVYGEHYRAVVGSKAMRLTKIPAAIKQAYKKYKEELPSY